MILENVNVLVIGSGISGIASAKLLYEKKAKVTIFDESERASVQSILEKLPKNDEITVVTGTLPHEIEVQTQLLVLSPGVPLDKPLVRSFKERGVKIWGEVELAYTCAKGDVIAITGTNGKTTTTALVGQIMKDYYESVFIVGNIGNAYTDAAPLTTETSVTVAEISSFQLETIENFTPKISAILNITPDHLNRHHTMENYVAAKELIAKNQTKDHICVLNYDDVYTRDFGKRVGVNVIYFSRLHKLLEGICLDGDMICCNYGESSQQILNIHDMKLMGAHNVENVMAAIAITMRYGVPIQNIVKTIREFSAVEHRIEYVATKKGVEYYNDSKGTNPDAAIKGILAMTRPTILIGGGHDKESSYDTWIEAFGKKIKLLVLIGQTKEKIAKCAREHGFENIVMADSLEEAVEQCAKAAIKGDAVLLSPACASWGMFLNYEARGNRFKELVNQLEE